MNVVVLSAECPSSSWRRAFADALIRLRSDLNPDAADELSDAAFLSYADLEPGIAATLFGRGGDGLVTRGNDGRARMLGSGA
jgi:hypothetical protein